MVLIALRGLISDAICAGSPVCDVLRAVTTQFAAAPSAWPAPDAQMPIGPLR